MVDKGLTNVFLCIHYETNTVPYSYVVILQPYLTVALTLLFQNSDDSLTRSATPGKFPLEDELEMLVQQPPTPSPVPSQVCFIT